MKTHFLNWIRSTEWRRRRSCTVFQNLARTRISRDFNKLFKIWTFCWKVNKVKEEFSALCMHSAFMHTKSYRNMKCKMIQKYADTQSSWINIFLMIYLKICLRLQATLGNIQKCLHLLTYNTKRDIRIETSTLSRRRGGERADGTGGRKQR